MVHTSQEFATSSKKVCKLHHMLRQQSSQASCTKNTFAAQLRLVENQLSFLHGHGLTRNACSNTVLCDCKSERLSSKPHVSSLIHSLLSRTNARQAVILSNCSKVPKPTTVSIQLHPPSHQHTPGYKFSEELVHL